LANKVQNSYGAAIAYILLNEKEKVFTPPSMNTLVMAARNESDEDKAQRETKNEEKRILFKLASEEHKKEL